MVCTKEGGVGGNMNGLHCCVEEKWPTGIVCTVVYSEVGTVCTLVHVEVGMDK